MNNVSDSQLLQVPLHDAEIVSITTQWYESNTVLQLRIVLNSEEELTDVISPYVSSYNLEVKFSKVWRIKQDIRNDTYPKESITTWKLVVHSELIQALKDIGITSESPIRHHEIVLSGGSKLDVIFELLDVESL